MDETTANSLTGSVTGPVVQAGKIGTVQIINGDQGSPVGIPQQLLLPPVVYVNRTVIHAEMSAKLAECHAAGRPALLALHGPAGTGVTTAVQKWYWDNKGIFPDGAIRISLGESLGESHGVAALDALNSALADIGVPRSELPASLAKAADRFRTLTAEKRFLLLLEDVSRADQVRPFVLNSPASAVVVTSKQRVDSLGVLDFRLWRIDPLDDSFSQELLRGVLTWEGGSLDDQTEAALLKPCHGLPLVIKLVAAQLTGASGRQAERRLRKICELGVRGLSGEAQQEVAAIFDLAYEEMTPVRRRVYRQLALLPSTEFSAEVVAALLDLDQDQTEDELDELVAARLLAELPADRFGLHETMRWHAEQRLAADEDESSQSAATKRMLVWYLRTAISYDKALSNRWRVGPLYDVVPEYSEGDSPRQIRDDALDWLETERVALVGAVALAERRGFDDLCWQLCEALWGLFHVHKHYDAWIDTHRLALGAALRADNDLAVMRTSSQLGSAYLATGEFGPAIDCFTQSLAAAHRIGHPEGEQSALEWLGKVEARRRNAEPALDYWNQSWTIAESVPEPQRSRMFALIELHRGRLFESTGRFAEAEDRLNRAEEYFRGTNESDNQAKVKLALGKAHRGLGAVREAVDDLTGALRLFEADGSLGSTVEVLLLLADIETQRDDTAAEQRYLRQALPVLVRLGDSRAEAVRARLPDQD